MLGNWKDWKDGCISCWRRAIRFSRSYTYCTYVTTLPDHPTASDPVLWRRASSTGAVIQTAGRAAGRHGLIAHAAYRLTRPWSMLVAGASGNSLNAIELNTCQTQPDVAVLLGLRRNTQYDAITRNRLRQIKDPEHSSDTYLLPLAKVTYTSQNFCCHPHRLSLEKLFVVCKIIQKF